MIVLGPHEIEDFLHRLDERLILDVCTDILAIEGHKNIRIMDGPGDGQRDIHSIDSNGNKCLTQSKYHADLSSSVPAKELGEVVLGMVRLGYKYGLFVTSTKISPQAKRDCLNDYPGYFVDFWDGREIVKKVFDNLVLKAIWYDGHSLDKVAYTITVPFIVRDLETDKPLQGLPEHTQSFIGNRICVGRSEIQINYQRNRSSNSVFGSYRSPKRKTPGELGSSRLGVTDAILSGVIHLEDMDSIFEAVDGEALSQTSAANPDKKHFALVFGTPSLTPLGGESSGARIELDDYPSRTIVVHNDFRGDEFVWVNPSENSAEWILPEAPRVSQASWIRWYNSENDMCLDIYVLCPPSDADRWEFIEQRDYFVKWWGNSLFMLVPQNVVGNWEAYEIRAPTRCIKWDDSLFLCSWLHPVFNSPIAQLSIEPEYEDIEAEFSEQDLAEVEKDFENIRNKLKVLGGSTIEPQKARHMSAILEEDPYPDFENVIYQGKHLGYYPDKTPTPILPDTRYFQFTVCWKIESRIPETPLSESEFSKLLFELKSMEFEAKHVDFFSDTETLSKSMFILFELELLPHDIYQSTEQALIDLTPQAIKSVNKVESCLLEKVKFVRSTREYWDNELLMRFKRS